MDILNHIVFGGVTSGVATALLHRREGVKIRVSIIALSASMAILPDIDVVSLSPKVMEFVTRNFGVTKSGTEIYFGKYWYSHHALTHSLTFGLITSLILSLLVSLLFSRNRLLLFFTAWIPIFVSFSSHLIGDMLTPGSVWGGVRLLYPYEKYYGNFGVIWWWNNYDLFILGVISWAAILSIHFFPKTSVRHSLIVFACYVSIFISLLYSRKFDFSYLGHTSRYDLYEKESLSIQKNNLGPVIFGLVNAIDSKLPFYF